jgi:hypothetical protein
MTRFFGAAVADAGFAPGPQRRAGVPCPQKAAQIAILSVFGPRKKPVCHDVIFSRRPAKLLLRGNQRRASGSTVLANSAHCPAALGQNLRTQPDFGNHSLIWQSL